MSEVSFEELTGQSEQHLVPCWSGTLVHREVLAPLQALRDRARADGIELAVASSFRSFERQLLIWRGKVGGQRPLLDAAGQPLAVDELAPQELLDAILRWSALPGLSRHHWGTDLDVYDAAAVEPGYRLQLAAQEYAPGGPFARLDAWLQARIGAGESCGFYRPYDRDRGGVAPEPWHISHGPTADRYARALGPGVFERLCDAGVWPLEDLIRPRADAILRRYVSVPFSDAGESAPERQTEEKYAMGVQLRTGSDAVWDTIRREAEVASRQEPVLASYYHAAILKHASFEAAISFHLANKLDSAALPAMSVREVIGDALRVDAGIGAAMRADIRAYEERDPACDRYLMPFLYFKGFHAVQAQRISHWLWQQQRRSLALYFQNQISQAFAVDIHPGAQLGSGFMIDHATGVVIGETAVVGDNVSMLHSVTLGGSGCSGGNRHPKIGCGVLISTGAKILGPIEVGEGAKIGAGSVVLESVPPHATVVGVPARVIGRAASDTPALDMDHRLD